MFFIFNKFKHIVKNKTKEIKKHLYIIYIKKTPKITRLSKLYFVMLCYVYSNHSNKKIKLDFNIRLILNLERLSNKVIKHEKKHP